MGALRKRFLCGALSRKQKGDLKPVTFLMGKRCWIQDVGSSTQNTVPDTAQVIGTSFDSRADSDSEKPEKEVLISDRTGHKNDCIVLVNGVRTGSKPLKKGK